MDHRALVTMSLPVSAFDSQEFRRALGRFPTGVTVIVAQTPEGSPVGLTASSFNSVSLSPPLVVWSLSRGSSSIRAFETCERYVIHVLAADQLGLAQRFAAGTQAERFADMPTHSAPGGSMKLDLECAAWFECVNRERYVAGDHVVLIGEVDHCHHSARMPLIYHSGGYDLTPSPVTT
jgi:flavin reductase (DIM6/NTAB) family NADH-FMN oxidoreductase RutF